MKKLFRLVPMLLISALLLCTPVYANEQAEPPANTEQPQTPQQPDNSEETEQPTEPETPVEPETPETPEEPETPETPEEPEQPEQPQKTVVDAVLVVPAEKRFVRLGLTPNFKTSVFKVTYDDQTTGELPVDDEYIGKWDTTLVGRQSIEITAFGKTFTEYFIVYDKTKSASVFSDITTAHWGYTAVSRCFRAGFLVGNADGSFGTEANMTRAQFCQMMYQVYKADKTVFTYHKDASFTDVAEGEWYYNAVTACAKSDIVNGMGDGTFNPNANITRQDVAVIMMRIILGVSNIDGINVDTTLAAARNDLKIAATDFFETDDYAKKYVAAALGKIYFGDQNGNITPKKDITRAECAAMMSNYYFSSFKEQKPLVYLSPSNQMTNQYANYDKNLYPDYTEGKVMTEVANKMVPILQAMGYDVHVADQDLTIKGEDNYKRSDEAFDMEADCYVAIHTNSFKGNDGSKQGATCYYNGNNDGARELSQFIYHSISNLTPTNDTLGSRNDMLTSSPFAEVKYPKMANVLIEVEFHDYKQYADWIVSNTDEIAKAISNGIDQYLKFKYTAA